MQSNIFSTSDSIFLEEEPLPIHTIQVSHGQNSLKLLKSYISLQAQPSQLEESAASFSDSHSDCTVHNKSSASPFIKYEGPRVILPSMLSCVTQQRFKEVNDSGFRHSERTTMGIKTSRAWAASSSGQFKRDCIVLDYQQMCPDVQELLWHSEDQQAQLILYNTHNVWLKVNLSRLLADLLSISMFGRKFRRVAYFLSLYHDY